MLLGIRPVSRLCTTYITDRDRLCREKIIIYSNNMIFTVASNGEDYQELQQKIQVLIPVRRIPNICSVHETLLADEDMNIHVMPPMR